MRAFGCLCVRTAYASVRQLNRSVSAAKAHRNTELLNTKSDEQEFIYYLLKLVPARRRRQPTRKLPELRVRDQVDE